MVRLSQFLALLMFCFAAGVATAQTEAPKPAQPETRPAEPAAKPAPAKLVIAFQKQKDPAAVQDSADKVAAVLTERLGMPVEVLIPANYSASVQALASGKAHVAYVSAIPYLLARQEAPVRVVLAEVRDDKTAYDSIFVVRKDAPYETLDELRGKTMMFTSPTSTSGYVMALSRLVNEGHVTKQGDPAEFFGRVGFAGGYDRALLAVLNGQADACAVSDYTMTGPKADLYLNEEQRSQLRILTRTSGVPTHLICVRSDLPKQLQENITEGFLHISENSPEVLADVYGASTFAVVEDEKKHLEKAVEALDNTGLAPEKLVK